MSGNHGTIDAGPTTRERLEGRIARWLSHVPGAWLLRMVGESPRVADGATLDPHLQSNAPNNALATHLFDSVVVNDEASRHLEVCGEHATGGQSGFRCEPTGPDRVP